MATDPLRGPVLRPNRLVGSSHLRPASCGVRRTWLLTTDPGHTCSPALTGGSASTSVGSRAWSPPNTLLRAGARTREVTSAVGATPKRPVCRTRYGDNPRARSGRRRCPARGANLRDISRPIGCRWIGSVVRWDRCSCLSASRSIGRQTVDLATPNRSPDSAVLSSQEFGSAISWRRTPFRLRAGGFRDQPAHSTGTKNGQAGVGRFGLLATRASRQPRSTLATARAQVALQALAHGTAST